MLLRVLLPTLINPVTDLVNECCKMMGLRDVQIEDLKQAVREDKVDLVFLLDGTPLPADPSRGRA